MPRYEFECDACEVRFEETRPFAMADLPSECPLCHRLTTKKVIAAVPILTGRRYTGPEVPGTATLTAGHGSECPCCRR